jgi:hypothetical protein
MQSRRLGPFLALGGVVIAVVLFVVLQDGDGDSETPTTTTTPAAEQPAEDGGGQNGGGGQNDGGGAPAEPKVATIVVRNGQPVGGVQELEFAKGDRIRFVVSSDVDEEVHLHGYDVIMDVTAGGKVSFDLPATIEGVFEAELEQSVVPLAEITVTPG